MIITVTEKVWESDSTDASEVEEPVKKTAAKIPTPEKVQNMLLGIVCNLCVFGGSLDPLQTKETKVCISFRSGFVEKNLRLLFSSNRLSTHDFTNIGENS